MIFIYNGPGASPVCVDAVHKSIESFLGEQAPDRIVKTADASYLTSPERMQGNALIMPGGNALTYCQQFSETQRRKLSVLTKYDEIAYLGICAGALFAGGDFLAITKTASAWGCHAKSQLKECLSKENLIQKVKIFDCAKRRPMQIVWWYGAAFNRETIGYEETVIADYERIDDSPQKAAALRPLRNVFLTHVHPEFQTAGLVDSLEGLSEADKEHLNQDAPLVKQWFQDQCAEIGISKRSF